VIPVSLRIRKCIYDVSKRALDIGGALVGLVLLAPLFVIVALAVGLDSPGPVLFRHRRCGKHGREFPMLKFRTMCADAEKMQPELSSLNYMDGPVFKVRNDPRVTRVGEFLRRTSLDELPQLLNVLRGEMSLVGPRPLVAEEMEGCSTWRMLRLSVRPGITGLWQVKARSSDSFQDWLQHDMTYVKRQSLRQDISILFQTMGVVLPTFFSRPTALRDSVDP
jgi:lipopolysaccharide/colanic/teichoic acid biosynthesis glycosyltransferase